MEIGTGADVPVPCKRRFFSFIFNFTIGHGELELKLNTDRQLSMFLWIYTDVYKQIYDWGIGEVEEEWCTLLTSLGTVHMQIYFDSCVFQFSFFVRVSGNAESELVRQFYLFLSVFPRIKLGETAMERAGNAQWHFDDDVDCQI